REQTLDKKHYNRKRKEIETLVCLFNHSPASAGLLISGGIMNRPNPPTELLKLPARVLWAAFERGAEAAVLSLLQYRDRSERRVSH
ncbi:hypothetical protein, partial [Pseudomonas amygdali]|uniref:hypothetical protein n=1 Tax=Pseudomonas amygdali TaxID=47877 RepID=UPI001EE449A5